MRFLIFAAIAAAVGAVQESAAQDFREPRFEVRETFDVVYGVGRVNYPAPGDKPLILDLYEPIGLDPSVRRPAFVAVHGGGWVQGDKRTPNANMANLARELASRGYVAVSINYRLESDRPPRTDKEITLARGMKMNWGVIQAAIEDEAAAVRWLVANADRLSIDETRIAIGGSSAGGGTSLYLGYGPWGDGLPIAAVVAMWSGMGDDVSLIEADDPPLLMIQWTEGRERMQEIAERAAQVGLQHTFLRPAGSGHNVPLQTTMDGQTLYQKISDFLAEHLSNR